MLISGQGVPPGSGVRKPSEVQTFRRSRRTQEPCERKEGRKKGRQEGRQGWRETGREGGGTKVGRKDDREEGRWREG
jgi:hypothetical protein